MLCEQSLERESKQPTAGAEKEAGAPDTSEEPRAQLAVIAERAGETVERDAKDPWEELRFALSEVGALQGFYSGEW